MNNTRAASATNRTEKRGPRPYSSYKDSDVEWLGKIPSHWEVRRLKTLASVQLSNVDKTSVEGEISVRLCNYVDVYNNECIDGEMEFMAATATPEQVRRFSLHCGDVLITKDSESWTDIAVPAVIEEDLPGVLCGYHLALVRPRPNRSVGSFLARTFSAVGPRDQFHLAANGITRFGLGVDAIRTSLFPTPPLEEQRAIAAFLDRETARIDALVAKKERLIELLQEKRAALITRAVTKGLDPNVPMKDSGVEWLGQIPAHWEVEENRWLFRESDMRSQLGEETLLTVSHITGVTPRAEKPDVTMIEAESHEGYKICFSGELAINTMWAWMGALGIASEHGMVSPSYNVYRIAQAGLVPRYYDYLCRIPNHIAEIIRHSKGIWQSRLRLYPDAFREIMTPVPPEPEQRSIVAFVDHETAAIDALSAKVREAIERIKELRTALISAAVTGKIDVRAA